MKPALAALAAALVLGGCATAKPWVEGGGRYTSTSLGFSLDLPAGWVRARGDKEVLLVTRDGPPLQRILVDRLEAGKPLRFTKKTIAAGMLPHEVAEVLLDDLRSEPGIAEVIVLEEGPVTLGGQPGFRAVVQYRTGGLVVKQVLSGALVGGRCFRLRYIAPRRHYFDRDVAVFERVRESFALPRA